MYECICMRVMHMNVFLCEWKQTEVSLIFWILSFDLCSTASTCSISWKRPQCVDRKFEYLSIKAWLVADDYITWNKMANQKSLRMEYIFPPGAGKILFIYRDFCAEDRVPVGTGSVAKNRSKSDSICLSQGWEDLPARGGPQRHSHWRNNAAE